LLHSFKVKGGLEGNTFAVRSSGTAEDGSSNSFAGQFETVLNVKGLMNVFNAVKTCWGSGWSEHVQTYLATRGAETAMIPAMAVVIQVQVSNL